MSIFAFVRRAADRRSHSVCLSGCNRVHPLGEKPVIILTVLTGGHAGRLASLAG